MWELVYKQSWALKNWRFWTVVLEKTLESPLDCKEIQPVHPKGNQSWIFTGRTDAETETPILRPPDVKNWLIGKDPDAGKDWRQQEKGMTENEMVRWHHRLNGHEFEQSLGVDWATELNSHLYMTSEKTIALTVQTFVGKVMSLHLICCLVCHSFFPNGNSLLI